MFSLRVPQSLSAIPSRKHECWDDDEEIVVEEQKRCASCGVTKTWANFHILKSGRPHSYCRACASEKAKTWNRANPEKYSARRQRSA